jgi:hypothetical protein
MGDEDGIGLSEDYNRISILAASLTADELLTLVNEVIRTTPGVSHAETFTYMHLTKQSYSWGTR